MQFRIGFGSRLSINKLSRSSTTMFLAGINNDIFTRRSAGNYGVSQGYQ